MLFVIFEHIIQFYLVFCLFINKNYFEIYLFLSFIVINVSNAQYSTRLLAATTLRNILGTRTLQEILQDKESLAHQMQVC